MKTLQVQHELSGMQFSKNNEKKKVCNAGNICDGCERALLPGKTKLRSFL